MCNGCDVDNDMLAHTTDSRGPLHATTCSKDKQVHTGMNAHAVAFVGVNSEAVLSSHVMHMNTCVEV